MRPFPQNQTLPLPPGGKGGEWWGMFSNILWSSQFDEKKKNNYYGGKMCRRSDF